ncbi:MAG: hypothetical protein AUJ49_01055 [Desulfovibrionaceae bacterium CG1_02_65_16]|nr:MAG: hypothetical protein AUJ49_01055 [Desulfovibrionaceae bacterium CG1_02_65_16]
MRKDGQPATFHVATLGCKINQYESEAISEAWTAQGLSEAEDPRKADVLLVNSCAVTGRAVSDLRASVRRLRQQNPGARIVVTGCAAQVLEAELAAMPEVDAVVPQARKGDLLGPFGPFGPFGGEKADASVAGHRARPAELSAESSTGSLAGSLAECRAEGRDGAAPEAGACTVPAAPATEARVFPPFSIAAFNRARAVVKVQDGCSHRCTYCIVPLTRGPSVSRDPAEVLAEMRRLLAAGYRELVLSGVNLRQYGADLAEPLDFWDLLARAETELTPEWAGRARLRLSSVEPGQLAAKAVDVLGGSRLVAPHLHLSLQSGDAGVLRRMGRGHYKPEQVLDGLNALRRHWPRFGLGADLLTGFPGETAEQFETTCAFCRELPLTYAHVFPYSPRPGTPAASLPDPLPKVERTARAARLRALAESKKRAFQNELAALPGLTVLVENAETGQGVCEYYAACQVRPAAGGAGLRAGALMRMRPRGVVQGRVVGAAVEDDA